MANDEKGVGTKKQVNFSHLKPLAIFTQLGFAVVIPIAGGVIIGSKLDEYFKTSPWLLIVCIILFTASAFMNFYKTSLKMIKYDSNYRGSDDGRD